MEKIVSFLKHQIGKEGPDYIWNNPFEVYQKCHSARISDFDARVLLIVLVNGTELRDFVEQASGDIPLISQELRRRCLLQKTATDRFATILTSLYSTENMAVWASARESGFKKFCEKKWTFEWEGNSTWDCGNGYVDCEFSLNAVIRVGDGEKFHAAVEDKLQENPFCSDEELFEHIEEKLGNLLDQKFDEYCMDDDDYYPPVAEDFDGEGEVEDFCEMNGLEIVECSYDGSTGDFEPRGRRY